MFESAKLKHHVDKAVYRREAPKLRQALLKAQYDLKQNGGFPVLIIIAGVEGAGKSETVNLLNEWMDPRHIVTTAFADRSDEERERPSQWRFWRALPPRGKIGIFFGGWHTDPIIDRVLGEIGESAFASDVSEILRLEKMLADDPKLKTEFEAKLAADGKFAKDPAARLQWFYERSKFYDDRYLLYPVGIER